MNTDNTSTRLDLLLVQRGLLPSRQRAKELIEAGSVTVNGVIIAKPSAAVSADADITVTNTPVYVGRGYLKLAHALDYFGVDISGKYCLDVGASTGGFTDCMLQNGAEKVYSVDVGYGQLRGNSGKTPA